MKIRGLWGGTQPSRLTCSRTPAPRPAPALTPLAGPGRHRAPVPAGAHAGRMWATHSGAPTAPPLHGNQALAAGSETRRRSVDGAPPCWGSVCLRNSPCPLESGSHLAAPSHERGSGVLACRRAGRLGGESVLSINTSPSGSRRNACLGIRCLCTSSYFLACLFLLLRTSPLSRALCVLADKITIFLDITG